MILRRSLIHLLLFININISVSQNLNIALFYDYNIKSVVFTTLTGKYTITGDGKEIQQSFPGDIYFITAEGDMLTINDKTMSLGRYKKIGFTGYGSINNFQLNPVYSGLSSREYDDNLLLVHIGTNMKIINKVDIEDYIAGVVEAEGGSFAPVEYYKAQAILVRTYTLNNLYRHSGEGFNLCDRTHCQAYKGKCRMNELIYNAVRETRGKVLSDMNNILINTPYHSNCGGVTASASDVWLKNLPYLVSVRDPFCINSRNAKWEKKISVAEWERYLEQNGINTENNSPDDYVFSQFSRKKYYSLNNHKIPLTKIRNDWHLKSAFFSITTDRNSLVIKGKGFGHGAGLCQEGAMEMAKVGYTCLDIIHFYYKDVKVIDKNKIINP